MRKHKVLILLLATVFFNAGVSFSQPSKNPAESPRSAAKTDSNGLATLTPPYVISTLPHFAVWIQFPKADAIRRIALGDRNYFAVEADKNDPHFAVVKQILVPHPNGSQNIETNMLVYMASGRVIDITLRSGAMQQTAYRINYPLAGTKQASLPTPPVEPPYIAAKRAQERASELLRKRLIGEMKISRKKAGGVSASGLISHLYRIQRSGTFTFVSFDVENTSSMAIDLESPELNLVTVHKRGKLRKKVVVLNTEPIRLADAWFSARQLRPGGRALGVVDFEPPAHDANQQIVLDIVNRAMADRPVEIRIE